MGEYAKYGSSRVKIGTCEDMYYLRAGQRFQVFPEPGNVDPRGDDAYALRFRFPWPNEDDTAPGGFDSGYKMVSAPGATVPQGVEHYNIQFRADAGYLLSLPCPEGDANNTPGLTTTSGALKIARNGFNGAVQLVAQKLLRDGRLVPVCRCGGCGGMYRMEDAAEIEALAVAFRSEADSRERSGQHNGTGKQDRIFWDTIADRILSGAKLTPVTA